MQHAKSIEELVNRSVVDSFIATAMCVLHVMNSCMSKLSCLSILKNISRLVLVLLRQILYLRTVLPECIRVETNIPAPFFYENGRDVSMNQLWMFPQCVCVYNAAHVALMAQAHSTQLKHKLVITCMTPFMWWDSPPASFSLHYAAVGLHSIECFHLVMNGVG